MASKKLETGFVNPSDTISFLWGNLPGWEQSAEGMVQPDCIRRINFMLQQGLDVIDIAVLSGDDHDRINAALPENYRIEYMTAEVVKNDLIVDNGLLVNPKGTRFRMLVLPEIGTIGAGLAQKITGLIHEGAVVWGKLPAQEKFSGSDRPMEQLAGAVWSNDQFRHSRVGKGLLIHDLDIDQALALLDCSPCCRIPAREQVLYRHRKLEQIEIYFVANRSDQPVNVSPEFRVRMKEPELWDPDAGSIRYLPAYEQTYSGTIVPLQLKAYESIFIVFRNRAGKALFNKTNY